MCFLKIKFEVNLPARTDKDIVSFWFIYPLLDVKFFPISFVRAASIAASVVGSQEGKKQKLLIWPEWSDADINAEKWVRNIKQIHFR